MTTWSTYLEEWSWGKSLLLKSGMLGIGVAAVIWAGWTQPNIQHPDRVPSPAVVDRLISSQPASTPVTTTFTIEALSFSGLEIEENNIQPTRRALLVDLNLGSRRVLETLPGIGVALADRIVSYRNIHGAFQQVDDLVKVEGIGEKRFQRLEPYVPIQPQVEG